MDSIDMGLSNKTLVIVCALITLWAAPRCAFSQGQDLMGAVQSRQRAQERLDLAIERRKQRSDRVRKLRDSSDRQWWNIPKRYQRDETLRDLRKESLAVKLDREEVGKAWEQEKEVGDILRERRLSEKLNSAELEALRKHDKERLDKLEMRAENNRKIKADVLKVESQYYRELLKKHGETKEIRDALRRLKQLSAEAGLDG